MDPLHNPLPPWAQPPSTAAVASCPAVNFPHTDDVGLQPHSYASQQSFPLFTGPVGAAPVPAAPFPASAPTPTPPAATTTVEASSGFHSGPIPSYAEMIFTAIAALKERDGSSKRAIAKYLDHAYPGQLPSSHSALLDQNLKRLKSNGMLVMVKKSYKLPGSGLAANINDLPDPSLDTSIQPPLPPPPQSAEGPLSPSVGSKRGRGRPPKAKPTSVSQLAETVLPNGQPQQVPQTVSDSQPPGFFANGQQTTAADVNANSEVEVLATQPVVPIGLADEGGSGTLKRGPGRPPKKPLGVDASGVMIAKRGRGRPPKGALGLIAKKRSPGRPRKPKPKTVAAVSMTNGYKRRPGRPPKNQANSLAVPYANVEATAPPSVPRPRGRPRKGTGLIAAGVGVGVLPEKRAGLNDGALYSRRSGRPVGRPKKYVDESVAESDAQVAAEFRRKLVFFQSRMRRVAGVLRPMLSNDAPSNVVKAVEELEELVSLDIEQELKDHHDLDVEAEVGES